MGRAAILALPLLMALGAAQEPANANQGQSSTLQIQSGRNSAGKPNPIPSPAASRSDVQPASQGSASTQKNGDSSASASAQPPATAVADVPARTEIRATLDTPLSNRTSKPGDRFTATISQPVAGRSGTVIPAGSRVEGEVTEADESKNIPALQGKGVLNLRLRDVVLPSGQTIQFVGSLVSVNRTSGTFPPGADREGEAEPGPQAKRAAEGGAGASAVVFGEPLKGLAIGSLAGGGYVLATTGSRVTLPAQTGMVIRLDQPLNLQ